ncbi:MULTISPECIES: hypothetical protein [Bacillus]|uniref:hypothetical protein n=1 Tax=Bacillus TaxID=1386 RepID=UPI000BB679BA|nr:MULTISPECIES: hypothetical protein [Bacillus]
MIQFKKLFWGFLFVFLEIHIFIDILPDPVGYFLIFSGLSSLLIKIPDSRVGKMAIKCSLALVILSMPSFFISQNAINQLGNIPTIWGSYTFFIGLLNIVLMFYVFQFMIVLAKNIGAEQISNKTKIFMKVYLVIFLLLTFVGTFAINMYYYTFIGVMVFSFIISLILEIYFLVLLWRFAKIKY